MTTRKRYTKEFKLDAIGPVTEHTPGYRNHISLRPFSSDSTRPALATPTRSRMKVSLKSFVRAIFTPLDIFAAYRRASAILRWQYPHPGASWSPRARNNQLKYYSTVYDASFFAGTFNKQPLMGQGTQGHRLDMFVEPETFAARIHHSD